VVGAKPCIAGFACGCLAWLNRVSPARAWPGSSLRRPATVGRDSPFSAQLFETVQTATSIGLVGQLLSHCSVNIVVTNQDSTSVLRC
jgi:hypothetical protein